MTIDDPVQNSRFLLKTPPTFYSAKIPFKHWQLRSLLCSPSPDVLYYPSNNQIYSLNTTTRKRRLVASLPFSPRCIGARYGWVCAGGADRGYFATVRMRKNEDEPFDQVNSVGAEMALDTEGEEDPGGHRLESWPYVNVKELGGSIVNSVTLHRPPSSTSDDDVLAVLTNNDKTVRIFHLAENRVVTTLHVDVSTNHASISPDGQHLVVVGDSPEVYFYHPASSGTRSGSSGTGIGEAGCGSWILSSHPPLTAGTENDALMSTSFSSSSLHCAIASQAGIITIFDTRYLSCDDDCSPLVKVITSSRAFTEPGAVRSVQFSPAPWDLLVWAEHCGRVCVADARSNFTRRQIVDVLVEKEDLIEAEVEEVNDISLAWDSSQSLLSNAAGSRRLTRAEEDVDEDARSDTGASINELADLVLENSSEWLATYTTRIRNLASSGYYPANPELMPTNPDLMQSYVVRGPDTSSVSSTPTLLRDFRERQIERERARQRMHDPPRRRNSIHPSYLDHSAPSSSNSRTADLFPNATSNDARPERSRPLRLSAAAPALRPLEQITGLIADQRRRQRRSGRFEAETTSFAYTLASDGVDITGCTLSPDGKKLFVATNGGVVEYGIDIAGRKVFPCITLR